MKDLFIFDQIVEFREQMFYIKLALFLIGRDYSNYAYAIWSFKSDSPLPLLERLAWHPSPFPSCFLFTDLIAAIFHFYCGSLGPVTVSQSLRLKINSKVDLDKLLLMIFSRLVEQTVEAKVDLRLQNLED